MSDPLIISQELAKEIENLPLYQEFQKVKLLYENDKELKELKQNIARLKSEQKEEEASNLLEFYNNHPLVINYLYLKEEIQELLSNIKNIISD